MEFRSIPSLDNKYEVNEDGTIFRNVKNKRENKIKLDMHHSKTGYYTTFIHIGGRTESAYIKRVMIHRVVAECWLGPCPPNMEVDHIDRNSKNNHYSNLRYVTKSEQMKNRDHSGISKTGTQNLERARKERMIQVTVEKDNFKKTFESQYECARYMGQIIGISTDAFRYYLKRKSPIVKGYNLTYSR